MQSTYRAVILLQGTIRKHVYRHAWTFTWFHIRIPLYNRGTIATVNSTGLSRKQQAISKTHPSLYLCIERGWLLPVRQYRMSWLNSIAVIPGKSLTNGLLLRRQTKRAAVTTPDECLTSYEAFVSRMQSRAHWDTLSFPRLNIFVAKNISILCG